MKDLQEIKEKKSVKDSGVSKDVSPTSPRSPRTVEEEEIKHDSVSGDGSSVIETDFNYGDYSCTQCERLFPSETNRQLHIESEHLRRIHEPYKSGSKWYCKNCKETGDKFHMQETTCKGTKKK